MELEIKEFNGEGYMPLIAYNGWRVAVVNFCAELLEENLCKIERHLKTDEVFILLEGEAALHIGTEMQKIPMETGKIYNVKCGKWHAISMKPDSRVAIIENDNTNSENSERFYFKNKTKKT